MAKDVITYKQFKKSYGDDEDKRSSGNSGDVISYGDYKKNYQSNKPVIQTTNLDVPSYSQKKAQETERNDELSKLLFKNRIESGNINSPIYSRKSFVSDYNKARETGLLSISNPKQMSWEQLIDNLLNNRTKYEEATAKEEEYRNKTEEERKQDREDLWQQHGKTHRWDKVFELGIPYVQNRNGDYILLDESGWANHYDVWDKRPEDYDDDRWSYDRILYDALHGEGTYDAWTDSLETDEESDEQDAYMDSLWDAFERKEFPEEYYKLREELREKEGNLSGNFGSEGYKKQIEKAEKELEARETVDEYMENAPEDVSGEYDPSLVQTKKIRIGHGRGAARVRRTKTVAEGDEIDNIYLKANTPQDMSLSEGRQYSELHPAQFMDPDQLEQFNKYYKAGDKQSALEFYKALESTYLQEMKMQAKDMYEQDMSQNEYAPLMVSQRIATQPAAGLTGTFGAGLALAGVDWAKNYNNELLYGLSRTNQNIQDTRAYVWGKQFKEWFGGNETAEQIGRFLNGVVYSMADNMVALAIGKGASIVGNQAMSGKIAEKVIQFVMSSEATASEMYQALKENKDPTEAALSAFGNGIIEAITEKYSIEALLQPNVKDLLGDWKQIAKYIGKNAFAEGSEEVASDMLGTVLDEFMSRAYGHKSELEARYDELKGEYGEKEASRMVLKEYLSKLGTDFLAGTLSGLLMSSGNVAQTEAAMAVTGEKALNSRNGYQGSVDEADTRTDADVQADNALKLVEGGKQMKQDSQSHRIALDIEKDMKAGRKVSKFKSGKLVQAIMGESSEQIGVIAKDVLKTDIRNTLAESGVQNADEMAGIVEKKYFGEELTEEENAAFNDSSAAQQTLMDYKFDLGTIVNAKEGIRKATEGIRSIQEDVMGLLQKGGSELKNGVENMFQGATTAAKADVLMAGGSKGTGTEVLADGKILDIDHVEMRTNEDGEQQLMLFPKDGGEAVAASDVKAVDENMAKALAFFTADGMKTISNRFANVIMKHVKDIRDIGTAMSDALNVRLDTMFGKIGTTKTQLSEETVQEIREATLEDFNEAEEQRVANQKQINPGQGNTTYNGAKFGTKEFGQALRGLGKSIRQEAYAIGEIAKAAGFDVKLIYDEANTKMQGWFSADGDGVTVNLAGLDANGEHHSALVTFAHEITHWLEANSREAYAMLREFIFGSLEKEGVNLRQRAQGIIDNYRNNNVDIDLNGAIAEMVAQGCDQILTNEDVIANMKQSDPTLFGDVRKAVQNLLNRVRGAISRMTGSMSYESRNLQGYMEQLGKLWNLAYDEARGQVVAAEDAGKTAASVQNSIQDYYTQTVPRNKQYFDNILTEHPNIDIVEIDNPIQPRMNSTGEIDAGQILTEARKSNNVKVYNNDGKMTNRYYVNVPDLNIDVLLPGEGIEHNFSRKRTERTNNIDNALIAQYVGDILPHAVEVNRGKAHKNKAYYEHVLVAGVRFKTGNGNNDYAVRFVVNNNINQQPELVKMEIIGTLNAIKEKQVAYSGLAGKTANRTSARPAYTIKLSEFFDDVKGYMDDTFAEAVYNKDGRQRNNRGFGNNLMYSIQDDAAYMDAVNSGDELQRLKAEADGLYESWKNAKSRLDQLMHSDEMNAFNERIKTADTKEEQMALIKEMQAWEDRNGIKALQNKIYDTNKQHNEAIKAYEDYRDRMNLAEEQRKIEESGMTEADWRRKQAINQYGYTGDYREAGYLLPNGRMLNFTGSKGQHYGMRGNDHRDIGIVYATKQGSDAMNAFMNDGNIRVMAETPGVDIIKEPTTAQYTAIRNMAYRFAGEEYFSVDFSDERGNNIGNLEYDGHVNPSKVVNDIRTFFRTGQVPQQSLASQFHYSVQDDAAYMEAVNNGDMFTAQRMVNDAALAAGVITNKRGRPLKLYHGTRNFGFTVFDTTRTKFGIGAIFTTSSNSVANGYSEFGHDRSASSRYIEDDGTDRTIIRNAKNVLGQEWRRLTEADVERLRAKYMEEFRKQAEVENKAMNSGSEYTPPVDIENEFWNVVGAFDYIINEDRYYFDEDREWGRDYAERNPIQNYYEQWHKLRDYFNENDDEYHRLRNEGNEYYQLLLNSYEHSDALIDLEHGYKRLLKKGKMFLAEKTDSVISRESLQNEILNWKNRGNYTLYGIPGDNPLEIDAEKSHWLAIKAPMIGDKLYSTDTIAKWAKDNGYTSVVIRNVMDPGVVNEYADDYVFFESNQLKSADPVTYDDDGNIIPPSERFNAKKTDIRYSVQDIGDQEASQWMQSVNPATLQTEAERMLLDNFRSLQIKIGLKREQIEKTRKQIREIERTPESERTQEQQRMLKNLNIKLQNYTTVKDQATNELAKITGTKGYARLMREQNRIFNSFIYGKTQEDVRQAVTLMDRSVDAISKRIEENRAEIEKIEKDGAIGKLKKALGTTTADRAAAELKKEFHSSWTKGEIRNFLDPILIKMANGEDFSGDVQELADILINSDERNEYEGLSALRGMRITIGHGMMQELRAKDSSIREIRRRLAGTGITVRAAQKVNGTWEASTLEQDIEDLRAEYPGMPDFGNEKDALENFVSWVEGMRQQSGAEYYDERLADTMAVVMQKAAGVAHGIYIPTEAKAQKQVLQLIEYVRGLNAKTEAAEKALQDIAAEMAEMKRANAQAIGMANVLTQNVGEALKYYDATAKLAMDTARKQKQSAVIEQLKSEQAKKILRNNEEWRNLIERDRQARVQAERNAQKRSVINTDIKRMFRLLRDQSATKNMPEYMQALARDMIDAFVSNDMSGMKVLRADPGQLEEAKRLLRAWEEQNGRANYGSILDGLDEAKEVIGQSLMLDRDAVYQALNEWNSDIRGKNKLDILNKRGEILDRMQQAVSEIYGAIQAERTVQANRRRVTTQNAAYKVMIETKGKRYREWTGKAGSAIRTMNKMIVNNNMTPVYFFRMLANEGLNDLWLNYLDAENRNGLELRKAQQRLAEIAEKHGYSKWDMKQKLNVDIGGEQVEMTLGQMMSLWATWKRENTLGPAMSEHLSRGGFYVEQDTREGILGRAEMQKKAHRVTIQDMERVGALLSEEQTAFINDVVGFMSNEMSQLGNEASMAAYGIKLYKENYYFPFQMWDGVRTRKSNDSGNSANIDQAFHPSFSKTRIHGANNALVIGDFMQTATDHIAGMINYATMGLANDSLQKVLNEKMTEAGPDGDPQESTVRNIRAILEEAYGQQAVQYLTELQKQLNGGAVRIEKTVYDKAISLFRKNAVAGSLSVAAQQPLSYLRAATMINPKYLAKALGSEYWKGSYKELLQHSGVAVIKEMGRFDMNAGQSAREYLTPDGLKTKWQAAWDQITDKATILPEKMDAWTWTRMWVAVKAEQHDAHPEMDMKSDEFLDMCGERFNDIMRRTQVYDSVLVRSENMRSQNPVIKSITSFMAEPTLTLNVLADAVRSAKAGEAGSKALLWKAGATFLLSAALQAAVKALFSTGRSPDDKKTWMENWEYRFISNLINEADPVQLIPGYSDLITLLKKGELADDAMGAIGKIATAGRGMIDVVLGNGEKGWWRDLEDSAGQLMQLFTNLPAKNISRDLRAMYNWFIDPPYPKRADNANVIIYQTKDAILSADNLLGWINKELGDAGYQAGNKAYYQRIYEAKKAGDEKRAQSMIDYLINGKGVKEKTIQTGIQTAAKNDASASAADTAKFMINEGSSTADDYIKAGLKAGTITEADAKKLLKQADPKATDEEIWWMIDRIKFQMETGADKVSGNYYRFYDAMEQNKSGAINEAVKMMLGHGMEAKNIKTQITKKYKSDYLAANNGGKVKLRNAIQLAYKALGFTATDADKVIDGWEKDKKSSGSLPVRSMPVDYWMPTSVRQKRIIGSKDQPAEIKKYGEGLTNKKYGEGLTNINIEIEDMIGAFDYINNIANGAAYKTPEETYQELVSYENELSEKEDLAQVPLETLIDEISQITGDRDGEYLTEEASDYIMEQYENDTIDSATADDLMQHLKETGSKLFEKKTPDNFKPREIKTDSNTKTWTAEDFEEGIEYTKGAEWINLMEQEKILRDTPEQARNMPLSKLMSNVYRITNSKNPILYLSSKTIEFLIKAEGEGAMDKYTAEDLIKYLNGEKMFAR